MDSFCDITRAKLQTSNLDLTVVLWESKEMAEAIHDVVYQVINNLLPSIMSDPDLCHIYFISLNSCM